MKKKGGWANDSPKEKRKGYLLINNIIYIEYTSVTVIELKHCRSCMASIKSSLNWNKACQELT